MADAIWNDRYILANGAVSANAPISGDGSNSQPLGLDKSSLYDANIQNVVITASLPQDPDPNTVYMIPEA